MDEVYEITYAGTAVGTAQVEKQGLYYKFSCRCRLPEEGLYRIHVICGEKREDLGVCIPLDGNFGMDKRIPAKRLGEEMPRFVLLPKDWKPQPATEHEKMPEELQAEEEKRLPESAEQTAPDEPTEETFIPVYEDEPFEYLDKLEDAVMEICDDTPGVIITLENS